VARPAVKVPETHGEAPSPHRCPRSRLGRSVLRGRATSPTAAVMKGATSGGFWAVAVGPGTEATTAWLMGTPLPIGGGRP
jgi:hypothetical protein